MLADCGGVFWDDVKDCQLESLLRDMSHKYFINGGKSKKGVTVVGRQGFVKRGVKQNPQEDIRFKQVCNAFLCLIYETKSFCFNVFSRKHLFKVTCK